MRKDESCARPARNRAVHRQPVACPARLDKESDTQEQAVGKTRQQRAAVARQLESERGALRQQVRAAYLMGRQQQAKLLLNQEDPGRLGRVLTYYDYLNRARVRQIETIRAQFERLQAVEQQLAGRSSTS